MTLPPQAHGLQIGTLMWETPSTNPGSCIMELQIQRKLHVPIPYIFFLLIFKIEI